MYHDAGVLSTKLCCFEVQGYLLACFGWSNLQGSHGLDLQLHISSARECTLAKQQEKQHRVLGGMQDL